MLDQKSNDFGTDVRYESEASLLGRPNHLVLGVSPVIGFVDDNRFVNVA